MTRTALMAVLVPVAVLAFPRTAPAQEDPAEFFKTYCGACHTIGGGRLTGPDLKDVTARRGRDWLERFIADPPAMIASGDPIATQLQQEASGLLMPALPNLTPALIDQLIDLIEAQSGGAAAHAGATQADARPFTEADVAAGRAIFSGRQRLASGGPACLSCHTVRGVGGLGGGQLAPDLTGASERLGGRQGLTAWLGAPPTPTMRSLFGTRALTPEETDALVAYVENAASQGEPDGRSGLARFMLFGFGLAAAVIFGMDRAWKDRLRSVRRALVERRPKRA
jgi:mono/diheme cytochrome c family protein